MPSNAMMMIRSDLIKRIDGLAESHRLLNLAALCEQVDAIRVTARTYGLEAVRMLASLLESEIAIRGHGPAILSYLDMMRDAVNSPAQDAESCAIFVAALSPRIGLR